MTQALPQRRSWLWLQGLVCGAAVSVAPAPVLLVVALLAPGLLYYTFEKGQRKPVSESMLLLGMATAFMPLRVLWDKGDGLGACLEILSDPARLGVSWMVAASGWLVCEASEIVAGQVSEAAMRRRIAALERDREALIADWGPLVPPAPPPPVAVKPRPGLPAAARRPAAS